MTTHNNNGQEYLMVEVPEGSTDLDIIIRVTMPHLFYHYPKPMYELLPPGQWQILFLASEATEEQAGEVVSMAYYDNKSRYKNYRVISTRVSEQWKYGCITAFASLQSLLTSYGLSSNCIVLKKIK